MREIKVEPIRRFEEFINTTWKQYKLGEISNIIGGGTPSTRNEEYWNGDIDWYSPAEIGEKIYVYGSEKKITELGLQKSSAKILPIGTVLFTSRAGIGKTAILAKEGATNQGFQSIVPFKDDLDSYFLFSRSHELKIYGEAKGAGSTFVEISGKQMAQMPIMIPTLIEQRKISDFLKQLDNQIYLQKNMLEKLETLKSAYLSEMFPNEGEREPKRRFEGFIQAWERLKLGDIFDIIDGDRGRNYPGESDFYKNSETLFLDTGNVKKNGFDFSNKKYITKEKDESLRSGKLELYDFVLTSRGTLGNVAYYDEKTRNNYPSVRINSAMLILRPIRRKQVSDRYIETVLRGNIVERFMSTNHVGSAQPHITKRDFSEVIVDIPSTLEEQIKIGTFFKVFDENISVHQRKLEKLQNIKKAYLNELFV